MPAEVTAASVEFVVDGVTYRLSPLRDRDYGEFVGWVQDRFLDLAKRNLDGLAQADRDTLLKAAYEKSGGLTITSPETIKLMNSVDGAAYLLYMSLRRETPEITHQRAKELSTNPVTVRQFMDRINELNRESEETKRPFVRGKKRRKKGRSR